MEIQRLSRNDKAEVSTVLCSAFHNYPVLRFVLHTTGDEYEKHLKALVNFNIEARFLKDSPVLGIRKNGVLIAAALLDEPSLEPVQPAQKELEKLRIIIGDEAYQRNFQYETESSRYEPESPHHFLGMIGVLPEHQGKGYARDLLNEVREISFAHPTSSGVCLSTEDSENVRFYQRFGYRVIAEMDIRELHSWCMFLSVR
jgi:ribosomal protein S18 acetylase RimI-like enzyme